MIRIRQLSLLGTAILAAAVGAFAMAWHARIFVGRAGFALDLEWMEGGVLLHALRFSGGQDIYVQPSIEFIPFLYTPLYPLLLALLSKVVPLGYLLGRVVSLTAFAGALGVLMGLGLGQRNPAVTVAHDGGAGWRAWVAKIGPALAGAGAVCAGFVFTGTFYDLVRADSLLLFLQAVAVMLAYQGRGWRSAALAGVCIALAFFTKQTASVIGVSVGLGLLITQWRRGVVFGLVAALVLAAGLAFFQWRSAGWFWTYIFELHQSHAFNRRLAFVDTPVRLLRATWPTWLALLAMLVSLGFTRRLQRRDVVLVLVALAGFTSACVGFGTRWAFENAFIPAVYFPVLVAAVLIARMMMMAFENHAESAPRLGMTMGAALLGTLALSGQVMAFARPDPAAWVPSSADHQAAARFMDIVRAQPGVGFIPFHPYYNVLAGKPPHVHRMGVMDVAARYGRPGGLVEAIDRQRFSFVVLDWKSMRGEWPMLEDRYHVVHQFRDGVDAVRSFSGAETSPRQLLWPTRRPPPTPPGGQVVADFETGTWSAWHTEGDAFGAIPAPARDHGFGRFIADSGHLGAEKLGVLRSPPFVVTHDRLRFFLTGPTGTDLGVSLIVGPETPNTTRPDGQAGFVEWDVTALRGQTAVLVIEDRSNTGALIVDQVIQYDEGS